MNFVLYKLLPSILFGFLLISVTNSTTALADNGFLVNTTTMQVAQQARSPAKQQMKVQNSQQAAQMAKARLGGKVLKVQKQNAGYRVKLIKNNGYIVSVFVDARSGRVSGSK